MNTVMRCSRLLEREVEDDQQDAVGGDAEVQPGPQLVQPQAAQPGVFGVVRLAQLLQRRIVIGQGTGLDQGAGEGAGLEQVVVGPLVVLGDGDGALQADDDDQDRQGAGSTSSLVDSVH
jgi:hypothetical protein